MRESIIQRIKKGKIVKFPKTYFEDERFISNAKPDDKLQTKVVKWRMKEKMKTVSVALVVCLNIGVDPPDIIKTSPCARLECWIDPFSAPPPKSLDSIGKSLQLQYERWQHRARYKLCLDPTVEEVKKLCTSLRRNAKEERVLFHYNGHGVPRPTSNGEIWVFNKNFTQYIPLSIYELQNWMSSPSIYVFDCSSAGLIVHWFNQFSQKREKEYERYLTSNSAKASNVIPMKDCILLAACGANELLPMNPEFPADLFTACLTTPIKIALRWFCSHSIIKGVTYEMLDKIPGKLNDRRTALGELNWIFTAVTDTIAWNVLPQDLFQKLFRQDLLVASLFRNFLLAERIMRSSNCTPISCPKLPPTYQHPMWQAWDLAADICLSQLPSLLENPNAEFKCPFFTEQLTAFEVWLEFGSDKKKPPEQLPIVLQVLLSQTHRLRALVLLGRFLDLGPWAVNQALSVGIFPYVLKLLQSPASELRQILVFIWTKILALDKSCQVDLVKDNGQEYFLGILSSSAVPADQRTMSAFILSVIADNHPQGQVACLSGNFLQLTLSQLVDPDPLLRRWAVLSIAKLWESFEEGKWQAVQVSAPEKLCGLLTDAVPEVRASVVYALGLFFSGPSVNPPTAPSPAPSPEVQDARTSVDMKVGRTLHAALADSSYVVRKELVIALSRFAQAYEPNVRDAIIELINDDDPSPQPPLTPSRVKKPAVGQRGGSRGEFRRSGLDSSQDGSTPASPGPGPSSSAQLRQVCALVWRMIAALRADPYPEVQSLASGLYDHLIRTSGSFPAYTGLGTPSNPPPTSTGGNAVGPQAGKRPTTFFGKNALSASASSVSTPTERSVSPVLNSSAESNPPQDLIAGITPDGSVALQSQFYEWSCQHFLLNPLMKQKIEDTTSISFSEKLWRRQRNKAFYEDAKEYKDRDVCKKLDDQIAMLDNDTETTMSLLLHPFEPLVVVADNANGISVWNLEETTNKINFFHNLNPSSSRISNTTFINEHDVALLLVASDDGVVRVWKDFSSSETVTQVTAWRALSELPSRSSRGMIVDWQQPNGLLFVSGDVPFIRIWDVEKEMSVQDILTLSETSVTTLTNDKSTGKVLIAGCGDGSIRLFDSRAPSRFSPSATLHEHEAWVVSASVPKTDFKIISGSHAGDVRFWDPRNPKVSTNTINTHASMNALIVHDYAPIFASGSQNQEIKVNNFAGDRLSTIRYHFGFLGQRIGPVSCLAFHPYKLLLGCGCQDTYVSVYEASYQ